jgi:RNA polymerase sigma-70 factor (ECF subfamily)
MGAPEIDLKWIDDLKKGDEKAFRLLVYQYQKMIFKTCIGIVHNADDADDVTQEVFIEAFHSIEKFRADSKISTWLYRIAMNKSLNFIRDHKRSKFFQSIGLKSTPEIPDEEHNFDQPFEALQQKQRKMIMDAAIDSLPENQRTAFVLSKFDELSYKEIAEIMNISIPSVESLLFRAKQSLQKKLLHCYKKSC